MSRADLPAAPGRTGGSATRSLPLPRCAGQVWLLKNGEKPADYKEPSNETKLAYYGLFKQVGAMA